MQREEGLAYIYQGRRARRGEKAGKVKIKESMTSNRVLMSRNDAVQRFNESHPSHTDSCERSFF